MRNLQKGFIASSLIAVIALLIIGSGIYIYKTKKAIIPASNNVPVQQLNQTQQPTKQNNSIDSSTRDTQTPSRPSITVLYPNVGEVLNNGGRDNIATVRWTTSNFGGMNITIGLLNKNGDWIKTIASNIPNTGNYIWKMDQTIASGEYKIAITSPQSMSNAATGPVASDLSDDTFVINTRSITSGKTFVTLLSPNGGETLNVGNKIIIKWSSLGEKPTSATISLSKNARCPYGYSCNPLPNSRINIAEISGNDLDKGEYEWTISKSNIDDRNNSYLIGITILKDNLGNANYDDSDSGFTIN